MDFDEEIEKSNQPQKVNTTPTIVEETIKYGTGLVDTDYLSAVREIEGIRPHVEDWKHLNLYSKGWRFQFGSSKAWAGLCDARTTEIRKSKNRNIFVSIEIVKHDANWKDNMKSVIYHEISHAIVREIFIFTGKSDILHQIDPMQEFAQAHGLLWNEICKKLNGGVCTPTYENANYKESFKDFRYTCFNCGHKEYGDYLKFATNCSKCEKAVITEKNPE